MELLIGCGTNRTKKVTSEDMPNEWTELITLDINEDYKPKVVHDLESLPLPFDDNMFDEIHAYEVLHQTGQQGDWRFFFNQFYEFWRILKPGGHFIATVPDWAGMWAWSDPASKRIITEGSLMFLSKTEYTSRVEKAGQTEYWKYWEGDFDLIAKHDEEGVFGFIIQAVK
jgi:SAM-dependent methyltransferase